MARGTDSVFLRVRLFQSVSILALNRRRRFSFLASASRPRRPHSFWRGISLLVLESKRLRRPLLPPDSSSHAAISSPRAFRWPSPSPSLLGSGSPSSSTLICVSPASASLLAPGFPKALVKQAPAFLPAASSFSPRCSIGPAGKLRQLRQGHTRCQEKHEVALRSARVTERDTRSSRLWHRLLGPDGTLSFASQDGVQFSAEQKEQASQVHPGHQNDNGSESHIGRVISVVFCDVELEQLGDQDPSNGEKNRPGQSLARGHIVFGREEIKTESKPDQGQ